MIQGKLLEKVDLELSLKVNEWKQLMLQLKKLILLQKN